MTAIALAWALRLESHRHGRRGHAREQLPLLQTLADRMPADTYVKDDVVAVQSAVLGGQDRTPPDLVPYWPVAAGTSGAVLALVLAVLVARLLSGRRRTGPQVAADGS